MAEETGKMARPDPEGLRGRVNDVMPRVQENLEKLVRIPSIALEGFPSEPVEETASAVVEMFKASGVPEATLIDIPNGPRAVYVERPAPPGAPTVLLYGHYDVQPPGKEQDWASPAFQPTIRGGRMYGRGAADCKSNVCAHAGALAVLGDDCPVGVKVLIEGEEEAGLGTLESFVPAHPDLVDADVIVVADTGNVKVGAPTFTTSLRGMAVVNVTVETLAGAIHSGMYGGVAPDALIALIHMLATLHDEKGNVAVKGLESVAYSGVDMNEADYRVNAGVLPGVDLIGDGSVAERLFARPSVTVIGMDVPTVEEAASALIPSAKARVSARLAPGQNPQDARAALTHHFESVAPWHVKVTIEDGPVGEGFYAKTDGHGYDVARRAMQEAYGNQAVTFGQGGSIPLVSVFQSTVPKAEIIMWGTEEPVCKIHAPNESVDLDELKRCVLTETLFLAELAA